MVIFAVFRAICETVHQVDLFNMPGTNINIRTATSYALSFMGVAGMFLGVLNVTRVQVNAIKRRRENWVFNVWLLICLYLYGAYGLWKSNTDETYRWIYNCVFTPLDASMFSILAFFIASAAYRAFRVRNLESILLMAVGLIVMLANVPIGDMIWGPDAWLGGLMGVKSWILKVPNAAAVRGIQLGIFLGAMATNWRVFLGIERRHLGVE